jgi:hypothetical protein
MTCYYRSVKMHILMAKAKDRALSRSHLQHGVGLLGDGLEIINSSIDSD